ncbi:hypothetical protein [Haloterrigena alkaliphila]|uniref:Uncharacterized protein n=1 Tax=Haloterrigena alkaliphila TaxID=2816475 RepID=A0A8A2VBB0_9EURY|nr:hypothetical protein [Haloterrigena alkaliphila]QSW99339.1 hypothetical protein J0X25_18525 [Haloterrigena alkaliphila]
MAETSVPRINVAERTEVGMTLLGIVSAAAAYYTGQTGNWEPLMAIAMGLALLVLFVTSES